MKLKIPFSVLFLVGFLAKSGFSMTIKTIDELRPFQLSLSNHSFNRIFVEGGGIKKIIAPEGKFNIEIEEFTHQAYISSIETSEKPQTISIITDAGYTQDIEVHSKDIPSETVILREPEFAEEKLRMKPRKMISKILKGLSDGHPPFGYRNVSLMPQDNRAFKNSSFTLFPQTAWEGVFDRVVVYKIKNQGKEKLTLQEEALSKERDFWVYIELKTLEPKQETICIVGKNLR